MAGGEYHLRYTLCMLVCVYGTKDWRVVEGLGALNSLQAIRICAALKIFPVRDKFSEYYISTLCLARDREPAWWRAGMILH